MMIALLTGIVAATWLLPAPSAAQGQPGAPGAETSTVPAYKPPARGVPGGRVGGASRGTVKETVALPKIELLAPDRHAGQTTSAIPTLYFYVSQPVAWPIQFTISAPARPDPVIEVNIPSPQRAGIYAVRTADYHIQLQPGVVYTWSISVILNPTAPSRDIVASASLLRATPDRELESALRAASANQRAALFGQAGYWYDAVAAAAEIEAFDRHAALDRLMDEVGLKEPARYDRQAADTGQTAGGTRLP